MIDTPKYAKIGQEIYPINTSFKIGLKCNEVVRDEQTSDYEKILAIIYLVFGDKGLHDRNNYDKLFDLALKYLSCGEEVNNNSKIIDMDLKQDFRLIKASFMSDYGIDISTQELDWYDFYTYLNGLTDKCILNRIRTIRTFDAKKIEDKKERQELIETQKRFALKNKEIKLSKEQEKSMEEINKILFGEE